MNNPPKYDVFVSYRRTSSESANLIATTLRAKGYRVFFDVESLRGGKFNEQLYDVIDKCTDFLLVLPENALDRCHDEEDWVRKEVLRAISGNKNIIPIMLTGFVWPEVLPKGLEELKYYQALTASSNELFPLSMDKLANSLMRSRKYGAIQRLAKVSSIVALCAGILIFSLLLILRLLSLPVCDKVSNTIIRNIGILDDLGEYGKTLNEEWNSFSSSITTAPSLDEKYNIYKKFISSFDNLETELNIDLPTDTLDFSFSSFESFILAIRDINAKDLETVPSTIAGQFWDLKSTISSIRMILEKGMMTEESITDIQYALDLFPHDLRLSYLYYLGCLGNMPSSAIKSYEELSKGFKYLSPMHEFHSEGSSFNDMINKESGSTEWLLTYATSLVTNKSFEPDVLDELNYFLIAVADLEEIGKDNDAEIAILKEKIAMMRAADVAIMPEVVEMNKKIEAAYEELKKQCTIDGKDGKWYMWGKIVKVADFMGDICQTRMAQRYLRRHTTSPISPEILYAFLSSQLNAFKEYHPDLNSMVESVKLFYKEVLQGKRSLNGVVVSEIKYGIKHPVFQSGDIIVSFKGQEVKNYEHLKQINKMNNTKPSVIFLRLDGSELVEHHNNDCSLLDFVGYNDLSNK